MGVRLLKEYRKETNEAIKKYEEYFNSDFPTYQFEYGLEIFFPYATDFEEEIVEVINDCLDKKKDVYELGYLDLEDIEICY